MGGMPISPAVLLTPQPSFPTTPILNQPAGAPGGMRNVALAMMKQDGPPSSSELQMQQRHQQLQQAQMQHIQQQQQRLAGLEGGSSPPGTPTSPRNQQSASPNPLSAPAAAVPVTQRLVATRIYIQTETDFKSVNLAPNTTALDVLHMLQQRGTFGEPGDSRYHDRWTVFEYSKEFLIERPLRDFEIVLDVIKTWEVDKDNKMICKSFPARNELSASEVIRLVGPVGLTSFIRPHGWVHLETKKGKWNKRYLHITDTAVYHSKDNQFNGESMLCMLRNFDVHAVQVPRKKAPTKFGFALKSSDSVHMFETPEDDYIHYVCTDSGDSLREWLAGLRAAKGMFMYHANPEMIREGQKRATELLSSANKDGNLTVEQNVNKTMKITHRETTEPSNTAFSIASSIPTFIQSQLVSPAPSPQHVSVSDSGTAFLSSTTPSEKEQDHPDAHSNLVLNSTHSTSISPTHPPSSFDLARAEVQSNRSLPKNGSAEPTSTSNNSVNNTTAKMPSSASNNGGISFKSPFMAGSLLQQRAEAEKQEVENMKLQLKMREQAGVLGARTMNSIEHPSSMQHQIGNHGRGPSTGAAASQPQPTHQQQLPQSAAPKFGGPGTLIEKGEARAAELQRSKSAGTSLLRPAHSITSYSRSRSKSRGPAEDRVPFCSRTISPHSPESSGSAPPVPQGPLLQFDDNDAKIQSGSLLSKAKSSKQASSSSATASANNMMSGGYGAHSSQARSPSGGTRGRQGGINGGGSSHHLVGQGSRTMIKPLIDLDTSRDVIGPGLLTNSAASGSQSVKSPRRNKPLLEF
ncbi:hypothetical protein BGZ65_008690 [Modicella reniformis]|uniref:PH domain-containing protein n=1 Tax=Modicella reniformis TaxID=1440133 RepID=A0A9P6SPH0_9FUNG|nr:hypothetical protein BGZ65_008690 [Modicella reniformis]